MLLKATHVEVGVPDLVIIELDGGIFGLIVLVYTLAYIKFSMM